MRQTYRSTYTYCTAFAMTYFYVNTYCCLLGKCIVRPIRIAALTPWHVIQAKRIDVNGIKVSVNQYVLLRLLPDIFFPQAFRSTNTYCSAYAMRNCSGNIYCFHWANVSVNQYVLHHLRHYQMFCQFIWLPMGKRIGRLIRIGPLTPWPIVLLICTAAIGTNVSVDQYVLSANAMSCFLFGRHILLPTGQTYRSTNM